MEIIGFLATLIFSILSITRTIKKGIDETTLTFLFFTILIGVITFIGSCF